MPKFGELITKYKNYNIQNIASDDCDDLDMLFYNIPSALQKMTVIEAERRFALENLRTLTSLLQTKRLHLNIKKSMKYFSL